MKLDLGQAAERLGITKHGVMQLEAAGRLHNLRPIIEGAKKVYRQYDQKEVNALKQAGDYPSKRSGGYRKPNGHAGAAVIVEPATFTPTPSGMLTRLTQIEQKLDQLLALWK